MPHPNTGISAILFTAGALCLAGGFIAFQTRKNTPGIFSLISLMLNLCLWDVSYGLFLAGASQPYPNFWMYSAYIGVVFTPPSVLWFIIQITGAKKWAAPSTIISLCVTPIVILALLATDSYHGLFFGRRQIENAEMILSGGPVFWVNVVYAYILILSGLILLARRFKLTSGMYRKQLATVFLGVSVPLLGNFLFVLKLTPLPTIDHTPLLFTLTGIIFIYALLRYRLLDVIPIARDVLIENMSDGVIVLDAQSRIVDFNPVALQTLGGTGALQIGQPASEAFAPWPRLITDFFESVDLRTELSFEQPRRTFYDLKISPLYDSRSNFLGRLIVWRDITPLKTAHIELQELAIRDPLTGLYNRRYLNDVLTRELAHAARENYLISLAIIDIDDFKLLNDSYGHAAGDNVLRNFAKQLLGQTREIDTVYRYGGEEFLTLMPNCASAHAAQIAERWRHSFQKVNAIYKAASNKITISCGIAEFPVNGKTIEELIAAADQFLYQAKAAGKNCVVANAQTK
ncbi:MAG: diguanylate cyclase [Anaerolineales bacterium]|nr:diguanylate cyclase [Anaerolineales bacterium]